MGNNLYESDVLLWVDRQINLLRSKRYEELDAENLIEELISLGKSERDKFLSSIRLIIHHLLKWEYQPEKRSDSWKDTIERERDNLQDYLEDTPSLVLYWQNLDKTYSRARRDASRETKLDLKTFPESCPYSQEQIESDWFPH